jgi:hypothetical protein
MRRPGHGGLALSVAALGLLFLPAMSVAQVPPGFVGMDVGGPIFNAGVSPAGQFARIAASGVESVRAVFSWSQAQPYANWDDVPLTQIGNFEPDPVPTTFAATDETVSLAAEHGLTVLPVVLYAPTWDEQGAVPGVSLGVPRLAAPYASYLSLLVGRYGPRGSFWSSHPEIPKLPIRMWEIWNEPNIGYFWPAVPSFVPGYVRLLRAAHDAIKTADPGAKVVLAGMPNYVWEELAKLYRAGARNLFDVVAVNPYTKLPQGVITILQLVRDEMDRNGDARKPMILTEFGWPSARHRTALPFDFETTQIGQARKLAAVMPLLAQDRSHLGLTAIYYYTWISDQLPRGDPFGFAGLLSVTGGRIVEKPAYETFRSAALALEGCASTSVDLSKRCVQRRQRSS